MTATEMDRIIQALLAMDRVSLIHELMHFNPGFPVDFTLEYLERQSDDRLRHVLLAMRLVSHVTPMAIAA